MCWQNCDLSFDIYEEMWPLWPRPDQNKSERVMSKVIKKKEDVCGTLAQDKLIIMVL